MTDPTASPPPKSDPEALVLRGKPRRVTRFKRHVVIGAAAAVTVTVCGSAWLALRVPSLKGKVPSEELYTTNNKPSADQLAALPASYDKVKVPQLGPPLPGDLGAAILAREKSLGIAPTSDMVDPHADENAARAERLRLAQLAQQAREGKVMFQTSGGGRSTEPPEPMPLSTSAQPGAALFGGGAMADDQNGQAHKAAFANQPGGLGTYNSHGLQKPASPYEILAGSVIPASLVTGLNSDLPGQVIAQVTQSVRDSVTGQIVLIPQGSRMIGAYDNVVAFGQSRALVVWQRIIMPDGSSIQIDNLSATDTEGYAGLADGVDYHTWSLLKGVALSTLLGVGTQLSLGNQQSDLVTAIRQSTQGSLNQAGQQITQKNLAVQPTLTVRPGWPLRVIVHKDLVLRPYEG